MAASLSDPTLMMLVVAVVVTPGWIGELSSSID